MTSRQELWCHECQQYVQFDIDTGLDGNHVIVCPSCGHEHCRVMRNGVITGDRWDSRNGGPVVYATSITVSSMSTFDSYAATSVSGTAGTAFLYGAWMNTTAVA